MIVVFEGDLNNISDSKLYYIGNKLHYMGCTIYNNEIYHVFKYYDKLTNEIIKQIFEIYEEHIEPNIIKINNLEMEAFFIEKYLLCPIESLSSYKIFIYKNLK